MNKHLVVIGGPTAVGKTDLAIAIASHFKTEIISADSRQFFVGLDIGTAKPTPLQRATITHHFIDNLEVTTAYNAGKFEHDALALLDTLFKTHQLVVCVGGSGLYLRALCDGFDKLPLADKTLRKKLRDEMETHGLAHMADKLLQLDPVYHAIADTHNPQRVLRALEVCLVTGIPYSAQRKSASAHRPFKIIKIGLELPREVLYERINQRVDEMMASGLEAEARSMLPHRHHEALHTVGYTELFNYLDGNCNLQSAVELIKQHTRNYSKRQMTWLRRENNITWFNAHDTEKVIEYIEAKSASTD